MKVFFSASPNQEKSWQQYYNKIAEEIELLGAELLEDNCQKSVSQKIKLIQKADICVFESSTPSFTIGFLIAKSLELNKPTIVLYFKETASFFLDGVTNEKLITKKYQSLSDIEKVVKQAFQKAQKLRDRRFNFFITPDLLNYLEETSRKMNLTKAMLIRNLIIEHRKKSH
jgi:hypothetical protein